MASRPDRIARVAREAFGFETLRPGQEEAIAAVLGGRDALVVMSTGSGKSAIYQIAGLLLPGATVVVSPLIALQREQVDDLRARAAGGAAQLNSNIPAAEREAALAELAEEALEFVFLAPEQLANPDVLDELAVAQPSLLVVDEAHCISEWGHDFRPDYLRLGAVAEALGRPRVLALTATAAPPVREEIVERLGLRDPAIVIRGFDRPNLRLAVERHHDEGRKLRALREHVAAAAPPGIVYVATRRAAEALAADLCDDGVRAASYHGGMRGPERDAVQTRFMADDLDVVVATTAFGMGVDKPNVRWVVHAEISESLDSYYQEIGRAGRDGRRRTPSSSTAPRTWACGASSRAGARSTSPRSPRCWRRSGRPAARRAGAPAGGDRARARPSSRQPSRASKRRGRSRCGPTARWRRGTTVPAARRRSRRRRGPRTAGARSTGRAWT